MSTNAAMVDPKLDPKIRNSIVRFIYLGLEKPKYYPGCWSSHKYFEPEKFRALNTTFEGPAECCLESINLILKIGQDGLYTRFEPIAFALAKCLSLTSDDDVRKVVYKAAIELCTTSERLMMFNKYTWLLKTGNGSGWCKSIKAWYLQKEPMELAKEVTRVRGRYGRSHNTLMRKAHIKVADGDNARNAIVQYVINGIKRSKAQFGALDGTKEVLDYIQKVEDMRHCEDPVAAAAIATANQFTLYHVPCHLLTSQDVWDAILPQMGLREILQNLQRIHNMGFLTSDSATTAIVVSLLNNQDVINKSQVTPIEVYIALNNYKNKTRPVAHVKANILAEKEKRRRSRQIFDSKTGLWEWSSTKRNPTEIKIWGIEKPPSQPVIASLNKLFDQTWLTTKPTNARYLITIDMRHHMFKGRQFCKQYKVAKKEKPAKPCKPGKTVVELPKPVAPPPVTAGDADSDKKRKKKLLAQCFYQTSVTPGHVAIIMALQFLKREKNAKLAIFTEGGIQLVSLSDSKFLNIDEAEFKLRSMELGRVQLDAPITWAASNDKKFDVFINIIDRATRFLELDYDARGGRGDGGRYGPPPREKDGVVPVDHCPVRALDKYRATSKINNARLVVMNLASHHVETTDGSHSGVLDIVGIDEHVPQLLDAFVLGHLD